MSDVLNLEEEMPAQFSIKEIEDLLASPVGEPLEQVLREENPHVTVRHENGKSVGGCASIFLDLIGANKRPEQEIPQTAVVVANLVTMTWGQIDLTTLRNDLKIEDEATRNAGQRDRVSLAMAELRKLQEKVVPLNDTSVLNLYS